MRAGTASSVLAARLHLVPTPTTMTHPHALPPTSPPRGHAHTQTSAGYIYTLPSKPMPSSEPTVADHFPRRPKQCAKQADAFFACFTTKGEQPPGGVRCACLSGLHACSSRFGLVSWFEACMSASAGRTWWGEHVPPRRTMGCMLSSARPVWYTGTCASAAAADFSLPLSMSTTPPHTYVQDKEAGRRGLAECRKEMAAYDGCMAKFLSGRHKPADEKLLFRVRVFVFDVCSCGWVGVIDCGCVLVYKRRCKRETLVGAWAPGGLRQNPSHTHCTD